jgi:hypothetical protein
MKYLILLLFLMGCSNEEKQTVDINAKINDFLKTRDYCDYLKEELKMDYKTELSTDSIVSCRLTLPYKTIWYSKEQTTYLAFGVFVKKNNSMIKKYVECESKSNGCQYLVSDIEYKLFHVGN